MRKGSSSSSSHTPLLLSRFLLWWYFEVVCCCFLFYFVVFFRRASFPRLHFSHLLFFSSPPVSISLPPPDSLHLCPVKLGLSGPCAALSGVCLYFCLWLLNVAHVARFLPPADLLARAGLIPVFDLFLPWHPLSLHLGLSLLLFSFKGHTNSNRNHFQIVCSTNYRSSGSSAGLYLSIECSYWTVVEEIQKKKKSNLTLFSRKS